MMSTVAAKCLIKETINICDKLHTNLLIFSGTTRADHAGRLRHRTSECEDVEGEDGRNGQDTGELLL